MRARFIWPKTHWHQIDQAPVGLDDAAEFRNFDHAAFTAAQAQGRPILLDVHAWWCPVCASQNHTIKKTVKSAAYDR